MQTDHEISDHHLGLFTLEQNRRLLGKRQDEDVLFYDNELCYVLCLRDDAWLDRTYERIGTVSQIRAALVEEDLGVRG